MAGRDHPGPTPTNRPDQENGLRTNMRHMMSSDGDGRCRESSLRSGTDTAREATKPRPLDESSQGRGRLSLS